MLDNLAKDGTSCFYYQKKIFTIKRKCLRWRLLSKAGGDEEKSTKHTTWKKQPSAPCNTGKSQWKSAICVILGSFDDFPVPWNDTTIYIFNIISFGHNDQNLLFWLLIQNKTAFSTFYSRLTYISDDFFFSTNWSILAEVDLSKFLINCSFKKKKLEFNFKLEYGRTGTNDVLKAKCHPPEIS